jgi:hypothetical protein
VVAKSIDGLRPELLPGNNGCCRKHTIIQVKTADDGFAVAGTIDEIIDFGAQLMGSAYTWCLTNGHGSWLDDEIRVIQDGKVNDSGHSAA